MNDEKDTTIKMIGHVFFQNLAREERPYRRINFRGNVGRDWDRIWFKYQFCTGRAFRVELSDDEGRVQLSLGLLFFSLWLTLNRLRSPKWLEDRHFGFYVFEWTFRFFWGAHQMESSSKDPWYYNVHFNVLDLVFGNTVYFEKTTWESHGPRRFEFRGKSFVMDDIKISVGHWFRSRIPFGLYCKRIMRMHLECKDPPKRAGKGENSWDLDDDGSYGMTAPYDGPTPSWQNKEEVFEHCLLRYCESVAKDIKRYGRASDDKAPKDDFGFKYIGRPETPPDPSCPVSAMEGP